MIWSKATSTLMFYLFAVVSVAFAIATVSSRRILRAAVYLMGVLAVTAGFYLLLGAPFLAGVQVLVYVGGIVVLIVYVVMLTRSSDLAEDNPSATRKITALLAALASFVLAVIVFKSSESAFRGAGSHASTMLADDTAMIGRALLDRGPRGYVLPFEIVSLLLLAVVIGGITLARKIQVDQSAAPQKSLDGGTTNA